MPSDADDVDTYLALAPEGRRAVLAEMRDACRTLLAGFDESMRYGMLTPRNTINHRQGEGIMTAYATSGNPPKHQE